VSLAQMKGLNVSLHEYQKQSVGFMLDRENGNKIMGFSRSGLLLT